MRKGIVAATAAVLLWATPALASHCPKDVALIDQTLKAGTSLSADKVAEVQKMRDEGEALHKAGKHKESVDVLHKALDMLGVKHD